MLRKLLKSLYTPQGNDPNATRHRFPRPGEDWRYTSLESFKPREIKYPKTTVLAPPPAITSVTSAYPYSSFSVGKVIPPPGTFATHE